MLKLTLIHIVPSFGWLANPCWQAFCSPPAPAAANLLPEPRASSTRRQARCCLRGCQLVHWKGHMAACKATREGQRVGAQAAEPRHLAAAPIHTLLDNAYHCSSSQVSHLKENCFLQSCGPSRVW